MAKSQGRKTVHKSSTHAHKGGCITTLDVSITTGEVKNFTSLGLYFVETFDSDGSQGHSITLIDASVEPAGILQQMSDQTMAKLASQDHGPRLLTMLDGMPKGTPDGRIHWQLNKNRTLRQAVLMMYVGPMTSLTRLDEDDMHATYHHEFDVLNEFNTLVASLN